MEKTTLLHRLRMLAPPPRYWPKWLLRKQIDRDFVSVFGRPVNWKNPTSFSEKIQVYKIYYQNPVMHRIVDKIAFKDYVREKLGDGYTAKLYAKWDRIEDVDLSGLTPPYVLKSNVSTGGKNLIIITEPVSDEKAIIEQMRSWFDPKKTDVYSNKYPNWGLTPCAYAEEYLADMGAGATDYKLYCFDGKVRYAYSAIEHFHNGLPQPSKISFYDADWNVLDASYLGHSTYPLPMPKHFAEMKEIAEKLSADFPFIRVDCYDTPAKPLLGELTFFPSEGFTRYEPESFDYEMGKLFHLPK